MKKTLLSMAAVAMAVGVSAQTEVFDANMEWLYDLGNSSSNCIATTTGEGDNRFDYFDGVQDDWKLVSIGLSEFQNSSGKYIGYKVTLPGMTDEISTGDGQTLYGRVGTSDDSVLGRPKFVKMGKTKYYGSIATRELSDVVAGSTLTVSFRACASTGAGKASNNYVTRDMNKMYVGVFGAGEIEGADHVVNYYTIKSTDVSDPTTPRITELNTIPMNCKTVEITNFSNSKAMEMGADYDEWDESISWYNNAVTVKNAGPDTQIVFFANGFFCDDAHFNPADYTSEDVQLPGGLFEVRMQTKKQVLGLAAAKVMAAPGAGIIEVEAANEGVAEYFNLQGVRVENPANGLYIKRVGNKATKVLVK